MAEENNEKPEKPETPPRLEREPIPVKPRPDLTNYQTEELDIPEKKKKKISSNR